MSKFFAGQGSSSDSEQDSDSSSDGGMAGGGPRKTGGVAGKAVVYDSDSSSEDEKRVVISHKDKAFENMLEGIGKIKNACKNNDWSVIYDEFVKVNTLLEKAKAKAGVPKFYIKMLSELCEFVVVSVKDKEAIKKMKKPTAHALNQMKLLARKQAEKFPKEIEDFKAHPELYAEEVPAVKKTPSKKVASDSDSDSDSESDDSSDEESSDDDSSDEDSDDDDSDSDFDSDSDESDSESEDGADGKPVLVGRAKWLKKVDTSSKKKRGESDDMDQDAIEKKKLQQEARDALNRKKKEQEMIDKLNAANLRAKAELLDANMTEDVLEKKVNELVMSRGKKGTDSKVVISQLEVLSKISRVFGPHREIPVLMHLISAMFDTNKLIDDYLDLLNWRSCYRYLTRIVRILNDRKKLVLSVLPNEDIIDLTSGSLVPDAQKKAEEEESLSKAKSGDLLKVTGSLESFITMLEADYTRALQQINPHTQEYIHRLSDEAMLIELAEAIQGYYTRVGENRSASALALLQLEHICYKHDNVAEAVQKAHLFKKSFGKRSDLHPACLSRSIAGPLKGAIDQKTTHPAAASGMPFVRPPDLDVRGKIDELCSFVFNWGNEKSKTRSLLCAVFHNALHDRYHQARDMFLISHIQETIDKADTKTQILYNRALVSMGLSAFRLGYIKKAHDCLSGVCSGRMKELLAQGQSKSMDPEQERLERRRQVPYHMHINPDLLECCHLISAMFLELPVMARGVSASITSRHFRKHFATYTSQVFTGPPENPRDNVLSAAKSLFASDWMRATDLLVGLETWNLLPENAAVKVKDMLRMKVKEESLRIYLFTQGLHYESLTLRHICDLFQMDEIVPRRIISKMIFDREISGAWDEVPEETLVLYKIDPTPIQSLSSQLSEKISQLVESNERLLDPLFGVYGYKDEWAGRDKNKQWSDQGRKIYGMYRGSQSQQHARFPGRTGGRGGSGRGGAQSGGRGSWSGRGGSGRGQTHDRSDRQGSGAHRGDGSEQRKQGWKSM